MALHSTPLRKGPWICHNLEKSPFWLSCKIFKIKVVNESSDQEKGYIKPKTYHFKSVCFKQNKNSFMATENRASKWKSQTTIRTCLCSPSTHPGSFRCRLHRNAHRASGRVTHHSTSSSNWESGLIARAQSLRAFLLQIIKPSSHDLQRRRNFQPRPTRFCLMNGSRDGVAVSWSYKFAVRFSKPCSVYYFFSLSFFFFKKIRKSFTLAVICGYENM